MRYPMNKGRKNYKNKGAYYGYTSFGGSGNDFIRDIKILPDGTYAALVVTRSTLFAGQNIAAYTDGSTYDAYGILRLNQNLNVILGRYWLSGNAKAMGGNSKGSWNKLAIDASGNIFYTYGDTGADKTNWKIYGLNYKTMALAYTADTAITVDTSSAYPVHYNGDLYVAYTRSTGALYIQKLNGTLAQQSNNLIVAAGAYIGGFDITATAIFVLDRAATTKLYQVNLGTFNLDDTEDISAKYNGGDANYHLICGNSNCYVVGTKDSDNDILLSAYNQSDIEPVAGWTDLTVSVGVGLTTRLWPVLCASETQLCLVGYSNDSPTTTTAIMIVNVDKDTGAENSTNWVYYPDSTPLYQASKDFGCYAASCSGDNIVFCGGATGTFRNISNFGNYDAIACKIDYNGKIVP